MRIPLRTRPASLLALGLLTVSAVGPTVAGQSPAPLSAADVARFDRKLLEITQYGEKAASMPFRPDRARRTVVTEAETNAYLRLKRPSVLPVGMVDPYVTAAGGGRVSARAVLDLDAVRREAQKDKSAFTQLLTGQLPVSVTGVLRTRSGIATFDLESASIAGIPIPKMLLQLVVSHYTRSTNHPNGVSLDAQFVLPAGIREIDIQARQAVIVQ